MGAMRTKPVDILMVEDNRGDVVLMQEALNTVGLQHRVHVVSDGVEAVAYLRRQGQYAAAIRPALIVLDLKLPRKNGREVLDEIMPDPELSRIPVALLSSSRSELEAARALRIPSRNYMVKPSTFAGYIELVHALEAFRASAARSLED
jgi:CheY-like chemotaxis protein